MKKEIKDTLDKRLANGELSLEDYERTIEMLSGDQPNRTSPAPGTPSAAFPGSIPSSSFPYLAFFFLMLVMFPLFYYFREVFLNYSKVSNQSWQYSQQLQTPVLFSAIGFGVTGLIIGIIPLVYLYKLWRFLGVQEPEAGHPSAGKVIGLMFVPLFNLYWIFVAYAGVCKRMNRLIAGTSDRPNLLLPFNPGLLYCIVVIIAGIVLVVLEQIMWDMPYGDTKLLFTNAVYSLCTFLIAVVMPLFILMTGRSIDSFLKRESLFLDGKENLD